MEDTVSLWITVVITCHLTLLLYVELTVHSQQRQNVTEPGRPGHREPRQQQRPHSAVCCNDQRGFLLNCNTRNSNKHTFQSGSVAEWLVCWTQAQ